MSARATADRAPSDRALTRRVNALRSIDNVANWYFLAREYLYLISVIGLTIAFYRYREAWGLGWAWTVPVSALAVVLIGAGQHRLTTLGHEASHYMLFRDRRLNELASDWFCMFPVFSTTQNYRGQHLAHHQHVNDPERDPDVAQMQASGHRFRFPMARRRFLWTCVVKQVLWPPGLVRYALARARYAAAGGQDLPAGARPSRWPLLVGAAYIAVLLVSMKALESRAGAGLLAGVQLGLWLALMAFYAALPARLFPTGPLRPEIDPRVTLMLRTTHPSLVIIAIVWLKRANDLSWSTYFWLLWVLPLVTAFPFFMLLRQVVQHGHADRGRLTNTRIFHVGALIRFAVFPLGMDYHLPHHLFPMVPHYRLRELHALLSETAAYRDGATVVEGYFLGREPGHPTVLDLMARPVATGPGDLA